MTPEEREILNRSLVLAEENNKMLHSMQRSMRLQRIMSALYWVFIIGSAIGAYYFLQPYLTQLMGIYSSAGGVLDSFGQ
ncbi:MAG TPA: hypothetical protein VGO63_02360 [Candidatus Paceibacterota bacterium]|jgi:hypothetical protein|nr:hypothetical protein [Candidatus Paceibacterota bacterium]